MHQSEKKKAITELPLEELPETETLFYKDDPMEFEAKVIKVFDDQVVLDRTSFYARGGGQEPDLGSIAGFKVVNVDKHANIIVHKLEGGMYQKKEIQYLVKLMRLAVQTLPKTIPVLTSSMHHQEEFWALGFGSTLHSKTMITLD